MRAHFRHLCASFTAEGPYALKNDFLDESAVAGNTVPTRISLAVVRPPPGYVARVWREAIPGALISVRSAPEDATSIDNWQKTTAESPDGDATSKHNAPTPPPPSAPSEAPSTLSSLLDTFNVFAGSGGARKVKKTTSMDGVVSVVKEGAFVVKTATSDRLAMHAKIRHTASGSPDNVYLFFNVSQSFVMADYWGIHRGPLEKITFNKARPVAHDVNLLSRSPERLEIIIGFTRGDLLLYDPFARKQQRMNKNGIMNKSMVTCVRWVPGSETLFMVSFGDGALMILDTEREDATFPSNGSHTGDIFHMSKATNDKYNPVSCWQINTSSINSFSFSPDTQHLATVSRDGCLRIFNFRVGRLVVTFRSYFGGLLCVQWSPDGKYIITGGEDDLVSIWNFEEQCLVARCEGHQSWVNDVAFDPFRCDEDTYRCGSVGEDSRLLLWDFSVNALNQPRAISVSRRHSMSSSASLPSAMSPPSTKHSGANSATSIVEALAMGEVPTMEPIVAKKLHMEPLSSICFRSDAILTACRRGHVKVWQRPDPNAPYIADADDL